MYMVTYGLLEFDRNSELNIILDCYCSAFIFNSQDILLSRTSTFTWGYSFFICKVWVFQPLLELKKDLQTQAKMSSLSQSGIWLFFAKTFDLPSFSIPPPQYYLYRVGKSHHASSHLSLAEFPRLVVLFFVDIGAFPT